MTDLEYCHARFVEGRVHSVTVRKDLKLKLYNLDPVQALHLLSKEQWQQTNPGPIPSDGIVKFEREAKVNRFDVEQVHLGDDATWEEMQAIIHEKEVDGWDLQCENLTPRFLLFHKPVTSRQVG